MGQYADIYVALRTRSKKKAIDFLNHFVPRREESADEYEFPQYAKKTAIEFEDVDELMSHLEINFDSEYNLYWRNTDSENPNKHGMLFYTKDDSIIFGISRDADLNGPYNTSNEDECLRLMKEYFNTDLGYITYEDTPYETFAEFKREVSKLNSE